MFQLYLLSHLQIFFQLTGTSTGALIILGLALKKSLSEILKFYLSFIKYIFPDKNRPYDKEKYLKFLKKTFGSKTVMGDIEGVRVMVPCAIIDQSPLDLYWFRNFTVPDFQNTFANRKVPQNLPGECCLFSIKNVAREPIVKFATFLFSKSIRVSGSGSCDSRAIVISISTRPDGWRSDM